MCLLVIENNQTKRNAIKDFLQANSNYEISASSCESEEECLSLVERKKPDFILISSIISGKSSFEIIKKLRQKNREQFIVVICDGPMDRFKIYDFICADVQGIIEADADYYSYISAIEAVNAGAHYYTKTILEIMKNTLQSSRAPASVNSDNLTRREIDILRLIANGLRNKEIANYYNLSVRTVEAHRLNIRKKTKAYSLQALIQVARNITQSEDQNIAFVARDEDKGMHNLMVGE